MSQHNLSRAACPLPAGANEAIAKMLSLMDTEAIYFSPHIEVGLNEGIIIIIVAEDSPDGWDEVYRHSTRLFEAYPQFCFRIFDADWIVQELRDGNPFFAVHCQPSRLAYKAPDYDAYCYFEKFRPKRFYKKAEYRHGLDMEAAFIAGLGVRHYKRWDNYLQAAYVLHQSMRFLFIAASRVLTGECIASQDLAVQQRHVAGYSAGLGKVFDCDIREDRASLHVLNMACGAVQDNGAVPEADLAMIEAIVVKRDGMRREVERVFGLLDF